VHDPKPVVPELLLSGHSIVGHRPTIPTLYDAMIVLFLDFTTTRESLWATIYFGWTARHAGNPTL